MIVDDPCAYSGRNCIGHHDCERCKVPEAFGFFLIWKRGKAEWEQRFIIDVDREAVINYYDSQIARFQKLRSELLRIPSKEEYERKQAEARGLLGV